MSSQGNHAKGTAGRDSPAGGYSVTESPAADIKETEDYLHFPAAVDAAAASVDQSLPFACALKLPAAEEYCTLETEMSYGLMLSAYL